MAVKDSLARGLKMTFLARSVHVLSNAVLMVLLTRFLLSPEEYGILFLALSIIGVARLFSDLGLAKSAARYVTEFKESDSSQVPYVFETALKYRLLFIGIVGCGLALGRHYVADLVGEPAVAPLLLVGSVYLGFHSLSVFNALLFQGFNCVSWSALVQVVNNVNRIVFAVLFVFVLGFGALGALLGYLVGAALGMCVGFVVLYKYFYSNYEKADEREEGLSRRILEYSAPMTITRGAGVLNTKIDTILIGVLLNPAAVGFYTLAKQISSSLTVLAGSLGFSISPTYGEQKVNERLDQASRMYRKTLEYTLLLYLPGAVGVIIVAEPTIRIVFGEAYLSAAPVLQVLGIYVVLRAINETTTKALDFLGRARVRAVAKGSTAVANFLLNLVLIPMLGVIGAAVATVITFGIYTLVNVFVMYSELPLDSKRLLRPVGLIGVITAGMGVPVLVATQYVSDVFSLVGVVLFGVAIWSALAIQTGLLDIGSTKSFLSSE
ncbi:flippase [Halorussus sp. MSC15.2]|uniref:flippase n=1 Tax=Halorussus sp. MSC15.2 TaxID=2283638 RepID=UPI002816231F|nr:flippase [Halorussus sp. MSC15.2]